MNHSSVSPTETSSDPIKYTVEDFNILKSRGDFTYYFRVLAVCAEKSEREEPGQVNLQYLPAEILCYISELATSSIEIFHMTYGVKGKLRYPTATGHDTYILKKCKINSLKAKSCLYAVGQINATPPTNLQGVRIRRSQKAVGRSQKAVGRSQKAVGRSQKAVGRSQKAVGRSQKAVVDPCAEEIVLDCEYFDYTTSNFKFHPDDFVLVLVYNHPLASTTEECKTKAEKSKHRLTYFVQSKDIQQLVLASQKLRPLNLQV
jgi:hypothetical protein